MASLICCLSGLAQERSGPFMLYRQLPALAGKRIHKVHQGRDGYLWIASSDGLIRFDGRRYRSYFQSAAGLTDNQIADVLEDRWPVLWPRAQTSQRIGKLLLDGQGLLWAATDGGLLKYTAANDSFRLLQPRPGLPANNVVVDVEVADASSLWVICTDAVYRLQVSSGQFQQQYPLPGSRRIPGLTAAAPDGRGGLWLVSWGQGFYHLPARANQLYRLPEILEDGSSVRGYVGNDVQQLPDSSVLITTGFGGLLRYRPGQARLERMFPLGSNRYDVDVQSISTTPTAGVWVGATGQLLQWHPSFLRLGSRLRMAFRPGEQELILGELAWDSRQQLHLLACAGMAGVVLANADFSRLQPVSDAAVPDKAFADIAQTPDGRWLALAYYSGRQYEVDVAAARLIPTQLAAAPTALRQMENDVWGRLWVATDQELVCYLANKPPVHLPLPGQSNRTARHTYHLRTDAKGRAWLGTNHGLYRIDADKREIKKVPAADTEGNGMAASVVRSMAIDGKNGVWVGYDGQGLQLIDGDSLQVVQSWTAEELPSSSVNSLAMGSLPQLLAATNRGLGALKKIAAGWEVYGVADGLEQDFLDRSIAASPAGKVLVNLRDGLQVFDEALLNQPLQPLQIHVSQLLVNNEALPATVYQAQGSQLNLSHSQNNINISFAAMHWLYPQATTYYYRLYQQKNDLPWQKLEEPNLVLAALRPGQYELQLMARGAGGSASEVFRLSIRIESPFWWRWWFIALCAGLLAAALYAAYRYRLRQILALHRVRNTISQNLHDDIGASLSNIQILNELAKRQMPPGSPPYELLAKAGDDVQQVSEALSDIVWNVSPRYDDLKNLFIR
ncbi:MAG: histidine kinase, partial [Chitinophagaceae bacterium]|nr:histidine kinase [Chitinophagaceae bacterium]